MTGDEQRELELWRKVGNFASDHAQSCTCERCELRNELANLRHRSDDPNIWRPLTEVVGVILRFKYTHLLKNWGLKYIYLRVDMRNHNCLIYDSKANEAIALKKLQEIVDP